jgi:hypothetical protein
MHAHTQVVSYMYTSAWIFPALILFGGIVTLIRDRNKPVQAAPGDEGSVLVQFSVPITFIRDRKPSTLNPQPSTLNPPLLNPPPSTLNPQPSTLNPPTLNPQPSQPSTLNPPTLNLRLNPQPSQPSTLQPSTLNPKQGSNHTGWERPAAHF